MVYVWFIRDKMLFALSFSTWLQFALINVVENKLAERSLPVGADWQCAIWEKTIHVEISLPHNKYTHGRMRFGSQLSCHHGCTQYQ